MAQYDIVDHFVIVFQPLTGVARVLHFRQGWTTAAKVALVAAQVRRRTERSVAQRSVSNSLTK